MKTHTVAALMLGGLLSLAAASASATTYDWTLTGPAASLGGFAYDGAGTLTTGEVGGQLKVTGITGEIGGNAITGLSNFFGADNEFFPATTLLDTSGLGVETASGQSIDIFSFYAPNSTDITPGNNYGEFTANPGSFGVGTFSASAVPEPASWAMFILGALGAGAVLRRRASRAASASLATA
jgi:hypothetical protein